MVPIGKKYADILVNIIFSITPVFETIGADLLESKRDGKKWSGKEILGHLIDSGYNNHRRIIKVERQESLVFEGYDQDYWVKTNGYKERDSAEILETFVIVQKHMAIMIRGLSDESLLNKYEEHNLHQVLMNRAKSADHANLSLLIWDYLYHIEHHLKQIVPEYINVCPQESYQ